MNTCGKCFFYETDPRLSARDGDGKELVVGFCYGAPPSIQGGRTEYPSVKEGQRECALWRSKAAKPKGRNAR